MGFELPQQRLFRGRHQVSNALLGHYPRSAYRALEWTGPQHDHAPLARGWRIQRPTDGRENAWTQFQVLAAWRVRKVMSRSVWTGVAVC